VTGTAGFDLTALEVHGVDVEIGLSGLDARDQRCLRLRETTPRHQEGRIVDGRLREIKRWGDPPALEGPALFLAWPAAAFVTGVVLPVDGGYTVI